MKLGDLSLIKETGGKFSATRLSLRCLISLDTLVGQPSLTTVTSHPIHLFYFWIEHVGPSSLVTFDVPTVRRIVPSAPRGRLVIPQPSRRLENQENRATISEERKVARDRNSAASLSAFPRGKETDVKGVNTDRSTFVNGFEDAVGRSKARGSPEMDEEESSLGESSSSPDLSDSETKPKGKRDVGVGDIPVRGDGNGNVKGKGTSFNGFVQHERKWFEKSGYNGCLDRLEELEKIVEAQFQDLSSKGYEVPTTLLKGLGGHTVDKDSPLKLEGLEKLELAVEKQHKDLIEKGVLPGDTLRIFT